MSCTGEYYDVLGLPQKAATWNQRKAEWLASVSSYASRLKAPFVVDETQYEKTMAELEGAQSALQSALAEQRRLREVVERLKEAKDAEEVAEVLAPTSDIEAFEELRTAADETLSELPTIAVEAIRYHIAQGYMPPRHARSMTSGATRLKTLRRRGGSSSAGMGNWLRMTIWLSSRLPLPACGGFTSS